MFEESCQIVLLVHEINLTVVDVILSIQSQTDRIFRIGRCNTRFPVYFCW